MIGCRLTRSRADATGPHGRDVGGIRVHRGFQDWGSIDTYEFQLMCLDEADEAHPQHEPRQQQQQQQLHGGDSAGATTLAELMAMGATDAWQLVSSLLAEPPTAVHARFGEDDPSARGTPERDGGPQSMTGLPPHGASAIDADAALVEP